MNTPSDPTVFIVDDNADMREALQWLLESVALPTEVFISAEEFLVHYRPERFGCLILDIRMPGMGGLQLLERLKNMNSPLPVIILTGHGDIPLAVQALKAGAFDFIEKPARENQLLEIVQNALTTDRINRSKLAEQVTIDQRLAQLTPREREVLERVVGGQATKTIALELAISEKTVEKHRERIMNKMAAESVAQLVRTILEHRWRTGNY